MNFGKIKNLIKQKFTSPKSVLDIVEYRCYYERLDRDETYCIVFSDDVSLITVSNNKTLKLIFFHNRTIDDMVTNNFMLCKSLLVGYNKHTFSHFKGNLKENAEKVKTIYYILYGV